MDKTIDLKALLLIAIAIKKRILVNVIICVCLGLVLALILPPKYESTTLVQMRNVGGGSSLGAGAIAQSLGISRLNNGNNSPTNYIELMKSRRVIKPIIENLDWPEEDKEFLSTEDFIKNNIKIETAALNSNVIRITAIGKTPEEAQAISQSVVDNFLEMQTEMNQETQSLLVKFLNQRVEEAKKEADEAGLKLAEYQKENKIYDPTEQTKDFVQKASAIDKAFGEADVQKRAGEAQLAAVNAKLGDMKNGSISHNINDNATVQNIRKQIVEKRLELTSLNGVYTDNHPSVINLKKELQNLDEMLRKEVRDVVESNVASLNPAQASLIEAEAQARVNVATAEATREALSNQQNEMEKMIDKLPQDVQEYTKLQRDSTIKNEVYVNLVKERENDKIQEAMESMDIQIIDSANLPYAEKPAFPKKSIFCLISFIIGCIISAFMVIREYKITTYIKGE